MIPLHSLPMGCVYNFLEYKSCIIHVYRRATSINYVSLLGARVFITSSFPFIVSPSLPLSLSSLLNHNSNKDILCCIFPSVPLSYYSDHGGQMDCVQVSTRKRLKETVEKRKKFAVVL